MPKDFVDEMLELVAQVNDPNRMARRAVILKHFFESDPDLKAKFVEEARQEAQLEVLQHLLSLKLGRGLTKKEGVFVEKELKRLGADDILKRLVEKDNFELVTWLSPKAAAPSKPVTKKAAAAKKPAKKYT